MASWTDSDREKLEKVHELVIEHIPIIKDIKKDLYGNGKPGLKQDVAFLKDAENARQDHAKDCNSPALMWIKVTAVATIIAGVVPQVISYIAGKFA